MKNLSNIHLCSGVYQTTNPETPAVKIICQTLIIDGVSYAWIDGVDEQNPVLLPIEHLHEFKRMDTLYDYLTGEVHLCLEHGLHDVMQMCTAQNQTPCTMVRTIELMHSEQLSEDKAIAQALAWGKLIHELETS